MTTVLQTIADSIALGSLYALFALGIALIFGIMRLVNFAHGELIMLAALAIILTEGAPAAVQILAAILVPMLVALGYDRIIFRPLRGADATTLLVTSFALSFFIINLVLTIRGNPRPEGVDVLGGLSKRVDLGPITLSYLSLVTPAVVALLLAALALFLRRTAIGVQMRAAAEDFEMTRLLGVRANVVVASAFAISGLLAGVGAVLLVAQTGQYSTEMGLTPVIVGFVASVIGGLGSLYGAVIGGYVVATVTVVLQVALPYSVSGFRDAFVYTILLLALVFRPSGIVPARSELKRV